MNKRYLAILGLATVLMTMVLRSMGRNWWCDCGTMVPWSWDIWTSHNSQHLIDPYFLTHVLHGVAFFWILRWLPSRGVNAAIGESPVLHNRKFLAAMLIEIAWEILENSPMIIDRYREATISLDYYGDSIANSIFDVLACLLGYLLASRFRWPWSLLLFVTIEFGLLLTIRDSLILNLVMLICPIDAIKDWQTPG